jgi:flavin-dependent dehydrogenase
MTEETFDVAVVGARCAGSATARLLAQRGLRVLVLDKASFPSDTVSTHGIQPYGVDLLRRWGLLDKVLATNVPYAHSLGSRLGELDTDVTWDPGSCQLMAPRRIELDDVLVQAARARGAEVRERATCRELITEHETVVGVRYSDPQDRTREIRARLVVGADGASSFVAKAVQAPRYDVRPSSISFRYAYYSGVQIERMELAWSHPLFSWAFPTNDNLTCMIGAMPHADLTAFADDADQALVGLFARTSPRLADALRAGKRETRFLGCRGRAARRVAAHGPGWALCGDAGYFKDPVTGTGISDAFAGAQLLADALIEGFEDPGALPESLARYQSRRDELFAETYEVPACLSSLGWTNDELPGLILNIAPSPEKLEKILGLKLAELQVRPSAGG